MEVECIEGYTLEGESTLTCGSRNDFTARKLPECVPIAGCETPIIGSSFLLPLPYLLNLFLKLIPKLSERY